MSNLPAANLPPEPTLAERVARVLSLARRGRRYLLGASVVFAIGLAVAVLVTLRVKRSFMSECTFVVRAPERPGQDHADSSLKRAAKIKDMVYERGRLESAIKKFNLYPGAVESSGILDAVESMKPHVGIRARESGRYVVSFDTTEADGIDARNLVRDVTQYLAESIAEDYVGGSIGELRNDAAFLAKEVSTASADIDTSVKAVTKFLAQHPEFATDLTGNANVGVSAVAKKTTAEPGTPTSDPVLAALYRQRARLEADLKPAPTVASAPPGTTLSHDKAQAAVDAAAKAYAEAEADLVAKGAKLTPEHPDMKAAQSQVAVAAARLKEARAALKLADAHDVGANPYDAPADTSAQAEKLKQVNAAIAAREAALKTGTAPVAVEVPKDPQLDLETEWQRVIRELSEAKKHYDELKSKSEAMQLALKASEASKANLISIIEPAYRPTHPIKGRRALTALLGLGAAVAFALLWMVVRVMLEDHLADAGDVEALGLATTLGTLANIPMPEGSTALARSAPMSTSMVRASAPATVAEGPLRIEPVMPAPTAPTILAVLGDDPKPIAALRLIRHRLEILQAEGRRTFAITSPRPGEGKSTFAMQLSLVLSESQRARVALVEADFHKPTIAKTLGFEVPPGAGLSAQVVRAMRGENVPWRMLALGPSFHVLAESEGEARFPRALHSACFQELLQLLAGLYDYVIVDGPCVLEGGEANALEPTVDGLILVTRAGVSKKSELRKALRQIGQRKTVGVVLVDQA